MKKFLFLSVLIVSSFMANAIQFTTQSFLSPSVTSVIITNGIGITNLNYLSQNIVQGQYQITTNGMGTSILGSIATNYCGAVSGTMYTDSVPVVWFGQTYPGTLTILTNLAVAASASTNDIRWVTINTNNQFNLFQDVVIPQDYYNNLITDSGIPGAAGGTNSIGYIQIVSQPFSLTGSGAVGNGSNIVSAIFSPVAVLNPANPGNSPAGAFAGFEPTDGGQPNGVAPYLVVSYTNQISVTVNAPTVANFAVPRYKFPGARGIRLRALYSGTSTNAIAVISATYNTFQP